MYLAQTPTSWSGVSSANNFDNSKIFPSFRTHIRNYKIYSDQKCYNKYQIVYKISLKIIYDGWFEFLRAVNAYENF